MICEVHFIKSKTESKCAWRIVTKQEAWTLFAMSQILPIESSSFKVYSSLFYSCNTSFILCQVPGSQAREGRRPVPHWAIGLCCHPGMMLVDTQVFQAEAHKTSVFNVKSEISTLASDSNVYKITMYANKSIDRLECTHRLPVVTTQFFAYNDTIISKLPFFLCANLLLHC